MKRLFVSLCALAAALCALPRASAQAPSARFTVQEMLKIQRVADPQLSPDGRSVAYQITVPDVAANRNRTQIYLMPAAGGEPRQLTSGAASATTPGWSPDGRMIAFASDVYADCADDACNRSRDEEAEKNPVKAHVATGLLYRHWTDWKGGKRTHVFVVGADGGAARDLTPGDFDAPPFSLGDPTDYAFSPDSKELAFARNTDRIEAASTNADIFVVPVTGGEPRRLTGDNKGADKTPRYSPDGRYIAYRSQSTAGFESDRWRLMLYDRRANTTREVLPKYDAYVEDFSFAPDGASVYFVSGERGEEPVFNASLADGSVRKLLGGSNGDVQISKDSRLLVFTRSTAATPTEIYTARLDGVAPLGSADNQAAPLTHTNDAFMRQFGLRAAEEQTWTGAAGAKVSGWLFRPPDFDASKKYPLVVLIHGGPQSVWNNNWGYRWNPQIYAARGYVVFMPNPRGSVGFGQQFTNEISGDWAGKAYTDIMNGVARVASMPFVDKNNVAA